MAPLPIPETQYTECLFSLDFGGIEARHNQGIVSTTSLIRDPAWSARFETRPLQQRERAIFQAWEKRLRGGTVLFTAQDYSRTLPYAYDSSGQLPLIGGSLWGGSASISNIPDGGKIIEVGGLPPLLELSPGDRFSLIQNGRYGYHEIVQPVVANTSGNATLQVEPPIMRSLFSNSADINFIRPVCQWKMAGGSFSASSGIAPTPVTFDAVQVI